MLGSKNGGSPSSLFDPVQGLAAQSGDRAKSERARGVPESGIAGSTFPSSARQPGSASDSLVSDAALGGGLDILDVLVKSAAGCL